ncbi:MAG: hypothetical protein P4L41_00025 [Flavipsychrobacter sp.]|nr:hypothetical protein [Flavipsychrobacter sp.]
MEGHIRHEYLSDYDLLIITQRGENREESDIEEMVENRFDFNTPVSPIAHTIDFVIPGSGKVTIFSPTLRRKEYYSTMPATYP